MNTTTRKTQTAEARQARLSVTSLSRYIRNNNCRRFLRFRLHPDEQSAMEVKWNATVQPLTPLLRDEGLTFEERVTESLKAQGEPVVELEEHSDASVALQWLRNARGPVVLLQPTIEGSLGRYAYSGRADVPQDPAEEQAAGNRSAADIISYRTAPEVDARRSGGATNPAFLERPEVQQAAMLDMPAALLRFHRMESNQVLAIAGEIAILGANGIDYTPGRKQYKLRSLLGEEFSGLE